MYIEKLEIKGFGKLEGVTLQLEKGVNIIYGPNESGKSTLQGFIRSMLYGIRGGRAGRDGAPPPAKRFKPWSGGPYGGSLEYRLDNGVWFRVERNFDTNTVAVFDSGFNTITGTFAFSRDKAPLFAESHLGLNETCFEKTVLVRQMDTRVDEESRAELLSRIANAGRTGFEDISLKRAQNALHEALKSFVGTERTRNSPMDLLLGQLGELTAKKKAASGKRALLLDTEAALNSLVKEKNDLDRMGTYLEQVGEWIGIRRRLEENRGKQAELAAVLAAMAEAEKAVAAAEAEYAELKNRAAAGAVNEAAAVGKLRGTGAPEGLRQVNGSYRAAALSGGGPGRGSNRGSKPERSGSLPKIAGLLALFGGAVLAKVKLSDFPLLFFSLGILAVAGLVLFIAGGMRSRLRPETGVGDGLREEDLRAAKALEAKLREIIRLKDGLKSLCEKASAISGMQTGSAARTSEILTEMKATGEELRRRLSEGIGVCMEKFRGVKVGLFDCGSLDTVLASSDVKGLEDSWAYESEKLDGRMEEAALKIREYETILETGAGAPADLQGLEEETEELERRKDRLEETGASLRLAIEVLEESAAEMQRDFAPVLNARMGGILDKITGGRYHDLKADDSALLMTVSPETGSVVQIPVLSGGTVDQMYLAFRLAAAELASGGESLPVLLDEAFSQYDDERTMETMAFLREYSQDGQVLLFTCKAREVELAEAVCGRNINLLEV